ncbi:PepSY domain-containing protein [Adhaeribacter pallidiroseus]|uniref:Thermolysin n=1 Tax=Adhaeribacter pallidiroseus TaxID=2072847 RepID=A0A369QG83_9BACT|nr:PepSY domain-containing protein [Adhaeribacter pallidiroseus]RDC63933.1 Thermolysin [Adhaeribacter pallidiroseus]
MKNFTKNFYRTFLLLFFLTPGLLWAQNGRINIEKEKKSLFANHVDFMNVPDQAPAFIRGQIQFYSDSVHSIIVKPNLLKSQEKDEIGYKHYKWQQTINGIPVEGAIYIQHTKNGKVLSQNGLWIKDIPAIPKTAALSAANALQKALNFVNAKKYKWEIPEEEKVLQEIKNDDNATYYPKGELVYFGGRSELIPANLRLAYKFNIYAHDPGSRNLIFVDVINGNILDSENLLHTIDAVGTATTVYSGAQSIHYR